MDEPKHPISSHDVYQPIGSHAEPIVIALGQPVDLSRVGELVVRADPSSLTTSNNGARTLGGNSVASFDNEERSREALPWHST